MRLRESFERGLREGRQAFILEEGMTVERLNASRDEAQMDRLLGLLSLTDQERGFVRVALDTDVGKDFWCVLADYLEEKGDPASARFRQMAQAEQGSSS